MAHQYQPSRHSASHVIYRTHWPLGGMADAGDLKSLALGHPGSTPGGATILGHG